MFPTNIPNPLLEIRGSRMNLHENQVFTEIGVKTGPAHKEITPQTRSVIYSLLSERYATITRPNAVASVASEYALGSSVFQHERGALATHSKSFQAASLQLERQKSRHELLNIIDNFDGIGTSLDDSLLVDVAWEPTLSTLETDADGLDRIIRWLTAMAKKQMSWYDDTTGQKARDARNPLDTAGLGRSLLQAPEIGLSPSLVNRLYKALHVYSVGARDRIANIIKVTSNHNLLGKIWQAYEVLIERADPAIYSWCLSMLVKSHKNSTANLKAFLSAREAELRRVELECMDIIRHLRETIESLIKRRNGQREDIEERRAELDAGRQELNMATEVIIKLQKERRLLEIGATEADIQTQALRPIIRQAEAEYAALLRTLEQAAREITAKLAVEAARVHEESALEEKLKVHNIASPCAGPIPRTCTHSSILINASYMSAEQGTNIPLTCRLLVQISQPLSMNLMFRRLTWHSSDAQQIHTDLSAATKSYGAASWRAPSTTTPYTA
jgi:hypothetical protein